MKIFVMARTDGPYQNDHDVLDNLSVFSQLETAFKTASSLSDGEDLSWKEVPDENEVATHISTNGNDVTFWVREVNVT